jgi:hypothetical protein
MKNFEFGGDTHATLQVKEDGEVFIQCLDAYGYQREMSIRPVENKMFRVHVYVHPGRREIKQVGNHAGKNFIDKLLRTCTDNPQLLFNPSIAHASFSYSPRNYGFILMQERIFQGMPLNKII